jgi:hypothetical protein
MEPELEGTLTVKSRDQQLGPGIKRIIIIKLSMWCGGIR